jgi:hypothetical protein
MSVRNPDGEVVHKYLNGFRGPLYRKLQASNKWKPRFFVLENKKLLGYEDDSLTKLHGEFVVYSDTVVYDFAGEEDGRSNFFYVKGQSDDVFYLSAQTAEEKASWMEAIFDCVNGGFKVISQPSLKMGDFIPTIDLQVTYSYNRDGRGGLASYNREGGGGLLKLNNGNKVKPQEVQTAPQIGLKGQGGDCPSCVSLLMFDLDSIYTNVDSKVAYLHWAVVNISNSDITTGIKPTLSI